MAAKIRLKRVGRKGQAAYRVVVLDGQKPRDAKVVQDLGHYDPKTNPPTFEVDSEGALKWLLDGAKATKAARDVLAKAGVMAAWDAAKRGEATTIEPKTLKPTTKRKKKGEAPAEDEKVAGEPAAEVEETAAETTADEAASTSDTEEETGEPAAGEPAEEEASEETVEKEPEEAS